MITNPFQTTVYLIQHHLTPPGFTAEESVTRMDVDGNAREVDVVVEGSVNGVDVCVSFEVTRQADKPGIAWAEQQITKHQKLPTSQLVLVSWNGVTRGALGAIEAAPNVTLWVPELMEAEGGSPELAGTIYLATYDTRFWKTIALVERSPGSVDRVRLEGEVPVYDDSGAEVATANRWTVELLRSEAFGRALAEEMARAQNSAEATGFMVGFKFENDPRPRLFHSDSAEYHKLHGFEVWVKVENVELVPVPIQTAQLGADLYGFAEVEARGHDVTLVAMPNANDEGDDGSVMYLRMAGHRLTSMGDNPPDAEPANGEG